MSNFNEEKQDGLGEGYHANRAKIRDQNAENAELVKGWEKYDGLKQPQDSLPKVLTEQEIHDKAKDMTIRQNEEQAKLEKVGLAQPEKRTFAEKQKANRGAQAVEQARQDSRQSQTNERKRDRKI